MIWNPILSEAGQTPGTRLLKLLRYAMLLVFMSVFCGKASAVYTTYEYDVTGPLGAIVHVTQSWELSDYGYYKNNFYVLFQKIRYL